MAQSIAATLNPTESALANEAWFEYLQLLRMTEVASAPDQAEREAQRRALAASRIDGVWRAFMAARGHNQSDWDVRIVNIPPGVNILAPGGGGFALPPGANHYGIALWPRTKPPG